MAASSPCGRYQDVSGEGNRADSRRRQKFTQIRAPVSLKPIVRLEDAKYAVHQSDECEVLRQFLLKCSTSLSMHLPFLYRRHWSARSISSFQCREG